MNNSKIHPAIQLTNAIIKWYSKPRRYVKNSIDVYEDKKGDCLAISLEHGDYHEEIPNICRTCLLGSLDMQATLLQIDNQDHKYRVKHHLMDLPEFKGFAAQYTTPQVQRMFIKVKKALQKELR